MKVLLGVSGGIAAYKAAELTRELQRRGAEVQVVMTAGAERFVTPLTFAALSGRQVLTSLWQPAVSERSGNHAESFDIEHIQAAKEAHVLVIAPATADMIAKIAHGTANDLLSAICLATTSPILMAPAMNGNMWRNPAVQANLAVLRKRGVRMVEPQSGYLACGMTGEGRLADPLEIADAICDAAQYGKDLAGETILITAGGTREPIDPVRYLGNRSSGKMGIALAEAALNRGAHVILVTSAVSGAEALPCEHLQVGTAEEMQAACLQHLPRASTVIMSAAVSDYRVLEPAPQKLKKKEHLHLELIRNPDILAQIVKKKPSDTLVIGFAAETENLLEEGRRKLREKGVDAIVANDVSRTESGFEVDRNGGILLTSAEEIELPLSSKRQMADRILGYLPSLRAARAIASSTRPGELPVRA